MEPLFNISAYLEKFKKLGSGDTSLKEVLVRVLGEVVGINISPEKISIKNGEIFLNVSPAIKNTVFIKKETILLKLKEKATQNILDIR